MRDQLGFDCLEARVALMTRVASNLALQIRKILYLSAALEEVGVVAMYRRGTAFQTTGYVIEFAMLHDIRSATV